MRESEIFSPEELALFRAVDRETAIEREREADVVEPVVPAAAAAVTLTAEQSRAWNDWANELIDRQVMSALKAITHEFAEADVAIRREYRSKLEALTADLASVREQLVQCKLEAAYLRGASDRDRGGHEIIDLPAMLPKRNGLHG